MLLIYFICIAKGTAFREGAVKLTLAEHANQHKMFAGG
jgi:hypothetical protein